MSAQEDRYALSQTIRSLKQDLDGIDFKTVSADDSDAWLDRIADVYIQIKQFISRRGTPDWNGWGPPIWNDIERGEAALNRRLDKERRKKLRKQRVFDKWSTLATVLFMAISAVAAFFSAYYAFQSYQVSGALRQQPGAAADPL